MWKLYKNLNSADIRADSRVPTNKPRSRTQDRSDKRPSVTTMCCASDNLGQAACDAPLSSGDGMTRANAYRSLIEIRQADQCQELQAIVSTEAQSYRSLDLMSAHNHPGF